MTGIVDDFEALRRAIARSERDHRQVLPCLTMVRTLEAHIDWRHAVAYDALRRAVSGLVTRPTQAMTALGHLDALEIQIIHASRARVAAAPVELRRVRHLALLQGGRAA